MKLTSFIKALEQQHPLSLAADWDPAGLQVEPGQDAEVSRILLTLDLSSAVVEEARAGRGDLIIAYHPPLFSMPDRLTQAESKARILMQCIQAGVAVYSPHTVLDAIPGGVTDWLAASLGEAVSEVIEPNPNHPGSGHGRWVTLAQAATAEVLAARIQSSLQLPWIRTTLPVDGSEAIRTVAVCPGAGHSVIESTSADALLTGEMRHHDLLAAREKGQVVFLCEHAASERGFLKVYAEQIRTIAGSGISVEVSEHDSGPLGSILTPPVS
jgi:dinuclear metal center YbgI/SA1388 family protein